MHTIERIDLSQATDAYKDASDPPGMWTGYAGVLPDCKVYRPRVGLVRGMELTAPHDALPLDECKALARRVAWERYVEAHGRAKGDAITMGDFIAPLPDDVD